MFRNVTIYMLFFCSMLNRLTCQRTLKKTSYTMAIFVSCDLCHISLYHLSYYCKFFYGRLPLSVILSVHSAVTLLLGGRILIRMSKRNHWQKTGMRSNVSKRVETSLTICFLHDGIENSVGL